MCVSDPILDILFAHGVRDMFGVPGDGSASRPHVGSLLG